MKEIYGLKERGIMFIFRVWMTFYSRYFIFCYLSFLWLLIIWIITFPQHFFIMHFLCISLFLSTYFVYVCAWFYFFCDWSTLFSHFLYVYVHFHLSSCFNIICIFQVIGVLSTIILTTPPFQNICTNCHVANVIIFPTCGVHCNTFHLKSMIQKLGFFSWFHCNQWWTCVIDYWRQIVWSNYAYDRIWNLGFTLSKTSSIPHFNLHSQ